MSDFRSIRVSAVVLRHADWGEADRLLTLYTREQGLIRAVAKGARKINSRKAGHLQPFTQVALQLSKGRGLLIVSQAETVNALLPLHDDLAKTSHAAYIVELLYRFSREAEGGNPALFKLLVDTLERIQNEKSAWLPIRYFEMRFLDAAGFRPQLFECVNCGREIRAEDQFFSAAAGGVICPRCGLGLPNLEKVSLEALKYLRHFQRANYKDAARANPSLEAQRECEGLMQGYFTHLLERQLNTPGFIKRIKNAP